MGCHCGDWRSIEISEEVCQVRVAVSTLCVEFLLFSLRCLIKMLMLLKMQGSNEHSMSFKDASIYL
jgi:hypothetical protein